MHVSSTLVSVILFGIISVLLAFTMLFEVLEEKLLHNCDKSLKPMVSSLFGEMTILGFLNLVIYCISSVGILRGLSAHIVDDSPEGQMYITELLEKVHYLLFFVMVLFICKVLFLLNMAKQSVALWEERNRQVQNREDVARWAEKYFHKPPPSCCGFDTAWDRRSDPDRFFSFLSVRKEFLLRRQPIPPFKPIQSAALPIHFDYAQYLSICLGKLLANVIHMPPVTWAAVWIFCGLFLGFYTIFEGNIRIIAAAWLAWGYINLYGISVLSHKLNQVYTKLLNPSDFPSNSKYKHSAEFLPYAFSSSKHPGMNSGNKEKDMESQPLKKSRMDDNLFCMPYWTQVLPCYGLDWFSGEHYIAHRHYALFWFGLYGPGFLTFLVRLHLLFRSLYIALVIALFAPSICNEMGYVAGFLYFLLSMLPVYIEHLAYLEELITTLCQVTNSGLLPNSDALDIVLRRHKTKGAVRAIIMMTTLVHSVKPTEKNDLIRQSSSGGIDFPTGATEDEIHEIGDVFDMYDTDSSGDINKEELEKVLLSLGYSLSHEEIDTMFNELDTDRDGSISREEFIDWHIRNRDSKHKFSKREMAKTMFDLFDTRKSGAIQISHLVERLRGLNHGLSTEDIVQLVNDLDKNGDGVISLEEFQHLLFDSY